MVVDTTERRDEAALAGLRALAAVSAGIAEGGSLQDVLAAIVEAVLVATGSDLAVARTLDADGAALVAAAVAPAGSAAAAELAGTRVGPEEIEHEIDELVLLPPSSRRAAEQMRSSSALVVPAVTGGRVVGCVELYRAGESYDELERQLARLGASQLALAARAFRPGLEDAGVARLIDVAGEALAAGSDDAETAREIVRLVAGTLAAGAILWEADGAGLHAGATSGPVEADEELRALAETALAERGTVSLADAGGVTVATLRLGEPPLGALQLSFPDGSVAEASLARLQSFAGRAAHALRSSVRSRELAQELERTRALLEVVGEAIAHLSLAHTLETAVERICALLGVEQIGVYLGEGSRLATAAQRGLPGEAHEQAAERLLELAHGVFRARGAIVIPPDDTDPATAQARGALAQAGLVAAVALPLRAHDESIGLLAAYPARGRALGENEVTLLSALAAQLAVAVQNARLHEQATELGEALGDALESERSSSRRLGALYEISRSFAQTLRLDRTLDAVARTVVELLDVDAAVVRVPDARGEVLVPQVVHVLPGPSAGAVRTILDRPHHSSTERSTLLDAATARRLGDAHALLVPFLEKGSTAAVVPIVNGKQLLASLTVLSLDPARPITEQTIELARSLAAQAALAIDNARLYQQQKDFSDTIQRSLLPRSAPDVEGVDVGAVYESSATVEVGGDVYDFLQLADGRLAVVLGDVTGHGIDATADMAMAKYVFRSLAREHPEPADFLEHANDVVVGEIALGKFITMAVVTVDPLTGRVACASAGHPAPRLVRADGRVEELDVGGIALGIDGGMTFEQNEAQLDPGDAVVLYTDGVIEARLEGELYGVERLDETLAARHALPARALAEAVLERCRAFGGEITDDTAVVVIKRTG